MSTTFAIFQVEPETDHHGELIEEDFKIPHVECAFRSRGIVWRNNFDIISKHLPDSTPVYALDNTCQGIFTIGDIKKEIKEQES